MDANTRAGITDHSRTYSSNRHADSKTIEFYEKYRMTHRFAIFVVHMYIYRKLCFKKKS